MEGFTHRNLSGVLVLFTIDVPSSWCLPLHWYGSTEFIFQPVYVLLFFSCCSVFRVITLYPSPLLLFALLISSLCCTLSVSSLLSLSNSSVCVCIVWVYSGREFLRLLSIGWQRPTRIGCTLCVVREKGRGGGGGRTPAGWGQGRAEIECVGVVVLRWQGLKAGEEWVGLSVSDILSLWALTPALFLLLPRQLPFSSSSVPALPCAAVLPSPSLQQLLLP